MLLPFCQRQCNTFKNASPCIKGNEGGVVWRAVIKKSGTQQITRALRGRGKGAGDRKAREKIAMRFVCSVDFASRSISMFFIFMHVPNV